VQAPPVEPAVALKAALDPEGEAGSPPELPPPQPAIITVISMVVVHVSGLLTVSNMLILFFLNEESRDEII